MSLLALIYDRAERRLVNLVQFIDSDRAEADRFHLLVARTRAPRSVLPDLGSLTA